MFHGLYLPQIVDPLQVYDNLNLGRRIDPLWPDETWRAQGGRNKWKNWIPEEDMEGEVRITMTNNDLVPIQ